MRKASYILTIFLLLSGCGGRQGEPTSALDVDEGALKKALASAAAMDARFVEKVSGGTIPSLEEFANQTLTLVLLISGYHHRGREDLRAYYDSAVPSQMIPDIRKGDKVSVLKESLTELLHYKQVMRGSKDESRCLEGTVRFEIPGKWSGNFGFVAERTGSPDRWKVIEFRLPESHRRVVLQKDGNWRVFKASPQELREREEK